MEEFALIAPLNRTLFILELETAGIPVPECRYTFNSATMTGLFALTLDLFAHTRQEVQAVIDAHDPDLLAPSQQLALDLLQVAADADVQAANIPGWASWTETEALAWHDTNIIDVLPVANLTEANDLLTTIAQENRAIVRLLIALRNKQWPNLQGS